MFYLLKSIEKEYNLKFYIVHINHLFRGDEADRDEQFVKELGKKNGIETFILRKKVEEYAKEKKIGFEEGGREVRYSFFYEIKEKTGSDKIAIAHNADDDVETFMFRLMRGSSISGLASIPEKRECYIRPIIKFYKKDILNYLEKNKLEYVTDETNFDLKYSRNRIRGELIPYIEEKFNPEFKNKIISLIEEIESFKFEMETEIKELINKKSLNSNEVLKFSHFKRKYILNEFFKYNGIEVSRSIIEKVNTLLNRGGSLTYNLPNKKLLKISYNKIEIGEYLKEKEKIEEIIETEIKIGEITKYEKYIIDTVITSKIDEIGKNIFYADYELIKDKKVIVRKRVNGDYFYPSGTNFRKKVNDFFIDIKIEKEYRDSIPIITANNEIIWIAGIRESEKYRSKNIKNKVKFILREEK
jgi:tRNA(Ile)-lysidine synthase